jgi:uncharacterized damage-inducible protein DinB
MLSEQITDTWRINNKVNLMLIDVISDNGLASTLSPRGRNVAQQFAHLHNVRVRWLEVLAKDLTKGLKQIEKKNAIDRKLLKKSLDNSSEAIKQLLQRGIANDGNIRGYKRGVVNLLGYFISHEAHHRGNILLTLKKSGDKVPKNFGFDIWEWNEL